ncbi:PRPF4 [Cordylochernes scorpioides]|uniref:PRPF4 n=1 Tax=Cordylochernes scorpioides TaxID=51811 RepID=A0ABY6KP47_9ARAC|nr:PRPF4 [Cordylochernes scorpioides]
MPFYYLIYKCINKLILNVVNPIRSLESLICKQRLAYFGHIMRENGLQKKKKVTTRVDLKDTNNKRSIQKCEWFYQEISLPGLEPRGGTLCSNSQLQQMAVEKESRQESQLLPIKNIDMLGWRVNPWYVQLQATTWYHQGPDSLQKARVFLAKYSLPRAKERLGLAREQLKVPDSQKNAKRQEIYKKLRTLTISLTQIGDTRPMSYCRFSPDSSMLATGSQYVPSCQTSPHHKYDVKAGLSEKKKENNQRFWNVGIEKAI